MWMKDIVFLFFFNSAVCVNNRPTPYYDTQNYIYNIPKVFKICSILDRLLKYYEKKQPKDPEWFIAMYLARGEMEFILHGLLPVPDELRDTLQSISNRIFDFVNSDVVIGSLIYRNEIYKKVLEKVFDSIQTLVTMIVPIKLGVVGKQNKYKFNFEYYLEKARTSTPTRNAADSCMLEILSMGEDSLINHEDPDNICELTPECSAQLIEGSGLAFQQMSRVRAASLSRLYSCMHNVYLLKLMNKLCIQVYKETKSLEAWDHPPGTKTLFIQQILYCASLGYGEFIKPRWMNKIMSWQERKGCYSDDRQSFLNLTGFVVDSTPPLKDSEETSVGLEDAIEVKEKKAVKKGLKCNTLTSAMAIGSLVVYIRALLETDHNYRYKARS